MKRMTGKFALALGALVAMMAFSSSAFALDGYQDRDGVYGGFSAGGGLGLVLNSPDAIENTDLQQTSINEAEGPGLLLQGVIGGGISDGVTLGLGADWWFRSVSKGADDTYAWHNSNIGADASFYIVDGFHVGSRLGFAYGVCSGTRNGRNCNWQEMGFAAKAGVGYEFWFNGNVAGTVDMDYTQYVYMSGPQYVGTANLTFGLRFY